MPSSVVSDTPRPERRAQVVDTRRGEEETSSGKEWREDSCHHAESRKTKAVSLEETTSGPAKLMTPFRFTSLPDTRRAPRES